MLGDAIQNRRGKLTWISTSVFVVSEYLNLWTDTEMVSTAHCSDKTRGVKKVYASLVPYATVRNGSQNARMYFLRSLLP